MNNIKIAMLCGGKGRRLKPLTTIIPKALTLLKDKPIIHHSIDLYSKQGIKEFILCVGHKGNMIKDYFQSIDNKSYDIQFVNSGDDASMLKRIYDLKDYFEDDIIITYGDTITDIDFKDLLDFHKKHGSKATIVSKEITSPFGLLDIQGKKVKEFKEKPKFIYYIGTMVLNKEVFEHMREELLEGNDAKGILSFFQKLIDLDLLYAYSHEGKELTFNTKAEMLNAEDEIINFYTLPENGMEK